MTEGKDLWMAVGQLHLARRQLVEQLAEVARDDASAACSFCGDSPPGTRVIVGSDAAICERCVELCGEILDAAKQT